MRTRNKLVAGVGINDANYTTTGCPYVKKWTQMLERAYSEKFKEKHPTYEGVTVCKEWHTFSNFRNWMESQDWQGKELDKDLLIPGNKVYSPEACVFVTKQVNNFITETKSSKGDYPVGVAFHKSTGKFQALCGVFGKGQKYLGVHSTPEEAQKAYWKYKCQLARELAALQTNKAVSDKLLEIYKD